MFTNKHKLDGDEMTDDKNTVKTRMKRFTKPNSKICNFQINNRKTVQLYSQMGYFPANQIQSSFQFHW